MNKSKKHPIKYREKTIQDTAKKPTAPLKYKEKPR